MARVRIGKFEVDEAELERQHCEAVRRGNEALKTEAQARRATYDRDSNRLIIELKNGVVFMIPCDLLQGLRGANRDEIAEVELMPRGAALHWEKLDVDFSVGGLMRGIYGNEAWMESLQRENGKIATQTRKRKTG